MGTKRPLQSREFLNLRPHMAGSNDMTHQPVYWLNAEPPPAEVEQPLFRFAAPHSAEPLVLELLLQVEESGGALPELELKTDDSGCRLTVAVAESDVWTRALPTRGSLDPMRPTWAMATRDSPRSVVAMASSVNWRRPLVTLSTARRVASPTIRGRALTEADPVACPENSASS